MFSMIILAPDNPHQSVIRFIKNYVFAGEVNARSDDVDEMRRDHP